MITEWTRRTQDATRASATRTGEGWTTQELEFVTTFAGDTTDAELALSLGRTLYAIQSIRHAIEAGKVTGSTRARANAGYRGWMEGDDDE